MRMQWCLLCLNAIDEIIFHPYYRPYMQYTVYLHTYQYVMEASSLMWVNGMKLMNSNKPLNFFTGRSFFSIFAFTLKHIINLKRNFSHKFWKTQIGECRFESNLCLRNRRSNGWVTAALIYDIDGEGARKKFVCLDVDIFRLIWWLWWWYLTRF